MILLEDSASVVVLVKNTNTGSENTGEGGNIFTLQFPPYGICILLAPVYYFQYAFQIAFSNILKC